MLGFLAGIVLSFLPKRYRERFPESVRGDLRQGAAVSGLVQCLVCLLIFSVRYLSFLPQNVGAMGERGIAHGAEEALISRGAQFGMGYVSMVEYIFHPLSLLLIYFTLEGAVRFYAAGVVEEIGDVLDLNQPVLFDIVAKRRSDVDNTLFANSFEVADLGWRPPAQRLPSIRPASFSYSNCLSNRSSVSTARSWWSGAVLPASWAC